jgi:hypothetical protein
MTARDAVRDPYGSSASSDPWVSRIDASFDRFEKHIDEALRTFGWRLTTNYIFICAAAVPIFGILPKLG